MSSAFNSSTYPPIIVGIAFSVYGLSLIAFLWVARSQRAHDWVADFAFARWVLHTIAALDAIILVPFVVLIPLLVRRWRSRFGELAPKHPTSQEANANIDSASAKWKLLIVLWIHLNVLPGLLWLAWYW